MIRLPNATPGRPLRAGERSAPPSVIGRPTARGKFLYVGREKLYVCGVTYGTFRPGGDGDFPDRELVSADFGSMAANGINAVRTYSVPPPWLLDLAAAHGLHVMVGIPWEQHVAFLDERSRARSIELRVRDGVRACAGHPAVLGYAVGNEIPSSIVRWHGRLDVERFIRRLYEAAKCEEPESAVTYVNYPSTEYLQLPFLDLVSFNVYLEESEPFAGYLARLQNIAGDRPLLLTELGLDSRRHGNRKQAETLEAQVRAAFEGGAAGAFVFAWTDEWHRGGYDVEDWDFGVTDRTREPKQALEAVRQAFADGPFPSTRSRPSVSVVVCSHNGQATLAECLERLVQLDYPDYEVIVVDDGSTDATSAIAEEYGVTVIRTPNRGLASARNTGLRAARGEIVAYLDDDASPDPHWLSYLASAFLDRQYAGVGGPNIPPPNGGLVAECVARAPGGPQHVLLSDTEAEHIPGCNMAFRRDALLEIDGFDPQFRVAGDDVDVCWRLQERGWKLGFNPGAVVWHRRRSSVRAYLRQQLGYGRAEALLERKWPEKYNGGGHVHWRGRIYGDGSARRRRGRWRIYYGVWGDAPFQPAHERRPGTLAAIPLMPEWWLLIGALLVLTAYEALWKPLLGLIPGSGVPISLPLLALALVPVLAQAVGGARASVDSGSRGRSRLRRRLLGALLHVAQPPARLAGRVQYGLTPWRRRSTVGLRLPRIRSGTLWSERWQSGPDRLRALEDGLRGASAGVRRGSANDRWDLQLRTGALGWVRLRLGVEEHGQGRQLVRYRVWPRWSHSGLLFLGALGLLCLLAALHGLLVTLAVLGALTGIVALRVLLDLAAATGLAIVALEHDDAPLGLAARQAARARGHRHEPVVSSVVAEVDP